MAAIGYPPLNKEVCSYVCMMDAVWGVSVRGDKRVVTCVGGWERDKNYCAFQRTANVFRCN